MIGFSVEARVKPIAACCPQPATRIGTGAGLGRPAGWMPASRGGRANATKRRAKPQGRVNGERNRMVGFSVGARVKPLAAYCPRPAGISKQARARGVPGQACKLDASFAWGGARQRYQKASETAWSGLAWGLGLTRCVCVCVRVCVRVCVCVRVRVRVRACVCVRAICAANHNSLTNSWSDLCCVPTDLCCMPTDMCCEPQQPNEFVV